MSSKSANYCLPDSADEGLLLLSEVALGAMHELGQARPLPPPPPRGSSAAPLLRMVVLLQQYGCSWARLGPTSSHIALLHLLSTALSLLTARPADSVHEQSDPARLPGPCFRAQRLLTPPAPRAAVELEAAQGHALQQAVCQGNAPPPAARARAPRPPPPSPCAPALGEPAGRAR